MPRFLSAEDSATDSGVVAGMSAVPRGAGSPAGSGAYDQINSVSSPGRHSAMALALATVASIFRRFRMMPASSSSRVTSPSVYSATFAMLNPAKAERKPSRRRRIVSQESPDWNASRDSRSNSASSPRTGRPHSLS